MDPPQTQDASTPNVPPAAAAVVVAPVTATLAPAVSTVAPSVPAPASVPAVAAVGTADTAAPPPKRPATADTTSAPPAAKKPTITSPQQRTQLQQQIQQQLHAQLQAQLQAAAARGQQANITPEQIQAQAQAMVQAAAQAQAVVAAAKSRGDGLVPMNQSQIAALSQIQAQAIVHARKSQGTPQQIQTQIQLQAQALVHAHTQAQKAAGIYKGDEAPTETSAKQAEAGTNHPAQQQQKQAAPTATGGAASAGPAPRTESMATVHGTAGPVPNPVMASTTAATPIQQSLTSTASSSSGAVISSSTTTAPMDTSDPDGLLGQDGGPNPSSSSPQFLAQLNESLDGFWKEQLQSVHELKEQTENDFKTHNDLPLARIKRIMKSDEDVRMISAEAPVLFAKACELFILDLSIRSWNYSQLHKRRTLQKEDIREAIQKTDIFDFLVDVI